MKRYTLIWLLVLTYTLTGCDLDGPMRECDYRVRLHFHYSREGSANRIRDYVTSITDYLFDSQGRLVEVTTRSAARIPQRTLMLPPGRYTLISWGNLGDKTLVHPSPEAGTLLDDMQLVKNAPHPSARGLSSDASSLSSDASALSTDASALSTDASATRGFDASALPRQLNCERLHYGRADFTVQDFGVQEQTVFMGHAYLDLTITVAGLEGRAGEEYTFRLDGTHPVYDMNHYRQINAQGFSMYIPRPAAEQDNVHLLSGVRMSRDGVLEDQFFSYRLTGTSKPKFSIWQGGRQVLRDIDLKHFFDTMLIDMDTNECQEFHLRITVQGDEAYVQFVTLGDWIEGGTIG